MARPAGGTPILFTSIELTRCFPGRHIAKPGIATAVQTLQEPHPVCDGVFPKPVDLDIIVFALVVEIRGPSAHACTGRTKHEIHLHSILIDGLSRMQPDMGSAIAARHPGMKIAR